MQATNLLGRDELEPQAKARNLLGLAYHGKGNAARARVCYGRRWRWTGATQLWRRTTIWAAWSWSRPI